MQTKDKADFGDKFYWDQNIIKLTYCYYLRQFAEYGGQT